MTSGCPAGARPRGGYQDGSLSAALGPRLRAPNWAALTVCEVNPDHGGSDGTTLRVFAEALADAIAASSRWRSG